MRFAYPHGGGGKALEGSGKEVAPAVVRRQGWGNAGAETGAG